MNIVIFGAASAIAQAAARIWAGRKASLFLVDRDSERLHIVADDLRVRGAVNVRTRRADLRDSDQHESIVQDARDTLHSIDIVLIAHGTLGNQQNSQKSPDTTLRELSINALSAISLLTILANRFAQEPETPRTLAVISSVSGDRGRKSNYVYGTAKAALTTFTAGLRHRLAGTRIAVITIKPGFVDTPMTSHMPKNFLWASPHTIGRGIVRAVDRKRYITYLPWFWRYVMIVIKLIPERIFVRTDL